MALFLLIGVKNIAENISCWKPWEDGSRWFPKACLCCLPASQHRQPSPHLCDKVPELVICGAPWVSIGLCFLGCTAGKLLLPFHVKCFFRSYKLHWAKISRLIADCNTDCCVCWLGIHFDQRHWMGLGWYCVALQHHLLLPAWYHQVPHQICS